MIPTWLIAVLCIAGVIGGFVVIILLIRAVNGRKKLKFKVPEIEQEPQVEIKEEAYTQPEPDEFEGINFDEPETEEKTAPQVEQYDPFEFDDDFSDDDLRYREFMQGRHGHAASKRELSPDEEFEKFRREHCYSKFVTDSELAKALKNAPKDVRDIILNDLLNSLNLQNYNDIKF